jgi:hypothetical protein
MPAKRWQARAEVSLQLSMVMVRFELSAQFPFPTEKGVWVKATETGGFRVEWLGLSCFCSFVTAQQRGEPAETRTMKRTSPQLLPAVPHGHQS